MLTRREMALNISVFKLVLTCVLELVNFCICLAWSVRVLRQRPRGPSGGNVKEIRTLTAVVRTSVNRRVVDGPQVRSVVGVRQDRSGGSGHPLRRSAQEWRGWTHG
jgi:hypothetical protein